MTYATPLQDFRFALNELAGLEEILKPPGFEEVTPTWWTPSSKRTRASCSRPSRR